MKGSQTLRGVALALLVLSIGGNAWAGDGLPLTGTGRADSTLSVTKYTGASLANVGQFPGNLVRLSCDANGTPTDQGKQPGYDYALVLPGDDALHALVPGTDEVRRQLSSSELQGADAVVGGKYYPSTGAIFVSSVTIGRSAGSHGATAASSETERSSAVKLSLARCAIE